MDPLLVPADESRLGVATGMWRLQPFIASATLMGASLIMSACGGGGAVTPAQAGSAAQLGPSKSAARGPLQTTVTFTIPSRIDAGETSPQYRGVTFLSPAVQGIEVAERCTGGTTPNCVGSGVGNAQTAVPSSGQNQQILYYLASSVCNNASPRVCTISFPSYPVAAGQGAQFEVDVLDTAPASNATTTGPASANLLGAGLGQPNQSPSGATSVAITTLQGIFGRLIFPATSLTGTVGNGIFPKFGDFSNARLQRDFGPGPIFVASASGAGNASGSPVSGYGANVGQDTSGNLIGTVNSGCVVAGPDQYGNSLTPSGSNDASDVLNGSVNGSVYAQLRPTSGQSTHHYAVEVLAGEAYAGAGLPLMSALVQPCGQSSSSFSASGPNNGDIGIAGADFPGDFFSWQYNPTNKAPTVSNAVSQSGGQTGDATNLFASGPSAPYFGVFAAGTQPYSDASMQYSVPAQFLYWIDQPIYGEAYIPSGSNGIISCVQSGGTQTSSGAPAEAFDAGPTSGAAGSFGNGGACVAGMVVNLFGSASGTTAFVYALQNWKPTGGSYSATPNANCSGVVTIAGPTGNVFQTTGVLASDGSTVVPYGSGAIPGNGGGAFWKLTAGSTANANTSTNVNSSACVVTFSDGYNSFNVTMTNALNAPNPPGVLSVSPNPVNIYGAGASFATNISVQETGYAGTFTETDTCHPGTGTIATFSPASGPGPTLNVTATGVTAGTCSITYSDSFNQQQTVAVIVTTSGFIIQGRHR